MILKESGSALWQDGAMSSKCTAMLLAAGRGERLRPLTDQTPKPLLNVRGMPLMQWAMQDLQRGGVRDLLINTAWLGEQIPARLGASLTHPALPPMALHYSHEGADFGHALETAGGIVRALPRLADVFWVAAGDVWAPGFDYRQDGAKSLLGPTALAHLWLVPRAAHTPDGDFGLDEAGRVLNCPAGDPRRQWTFSTIGLYRRALFEAPHQALPPGNPAGQALPLAPLLRAAMDQGLVRGTVWRGPWVDVGTPERLAALNAGA